jgi:hypothetical protein
VAMRTAVVRVIRFMPRSMYGPRTHTYPTMVLSASHTGF